jgi:transposase
MGVGRAQGRRKPRCEGRVGLALRARPGVWPGTAEAPLIVAPVPSGGQHAGQTLCPLRSPRGSVYVEEYPMDLPVVNPRCCGLDIHKRSITACLLVPAADGSVARTTRTFGTMTRDLRALQHWLQEAGVTHVAMESTGVYWKPLFNLFEGHFTLLLVNAQHVKQVPGRKSDARDCEWLAVLLRHGLLNSSYVPSREQRELRELTRYRISLVQEHSAELNRLEKTLEGANIKLAAVVSTLATRSAREMIEHLAAGESDPQALADLARGRLRQKLAALEAALEGQVGAHQRFLLQQQLAHLVHLEGLITAVSAEVARRLAPYEAILQRLETIPGVGRRVAEQLVAEIGLDMSRFPTAGHLASWSGMCPGQDESAGKRRSGKTRPGNRWLKATLVEAAHGAARTKDSYPRAQHHRLAARRGKRRATVAVGHTLLTAAYYVLRDGVEYQDLGAHYFDERDRTGVIRRAVARLEALGLRVIIEDPEAELTVAA